MDLAGNFESMVEYIVNLVITIMMQIVNAVV